MSTKKIVLLPGDGIGPEVTACARAVLEAAAASAGLSLSVTSHLVGGHAIDETSRPLPDATIDACREADAIFLGAVGGPKWDGAPRRPEQGLLSLRRGLELYANLRPVRIFKALINGSPLKPERLEGVDILFVRELTGGIYFGAPKFQETTSSGRRGVDTMEYTEGEVRRIARVAFKLAATRRQKVTSVDKANVLASSQLWRTVVNEVSTEFSGVVLEHRLVDSTAMRLITAPTDFDVVVSSNMFGDILSDEAAVFAGSLGTLPSASIGDGGPGLYEPVHGSAPDIAGQGIANPIGAILSVAMMFRHSLGQEEAARAIEAAVAATLSAGARTHDLGGALSTAQMADLIVGNLRASEAA